MVLCANGTVRIRHCAQKVAVRNCRVRKNFAQSTCAHMTFAHTSIAQNFCANDNCAQLLFAHSATCAQRLLRTTPLAHN